jgi:hypothetical protein
MKGIERIEVFSLVGTMVLSMQNDLTPDARLILKGLEPGIYFIKLLTSDKGYLTSKFIKN